jgi:hypothetical protein
MNGKGVGFTGCTGLVGDKERRVHRGEAVERTEGRGRKAEDGRQRKRTKEVVGLPGGLKLLFDIQVVVDLTVDRQHEVLLVVEKGL